MYSYNCAMQLYVPKRARKSVVSPCHVLRTHNREAAVQLHCTLLILSSTDHKRQSLNRLGHATCNASTPAASRLLCQLVCCAAIITTKLNASQTAPLSNTWRSCWRHFATFLILQLTVEHVEHCGPSAELITKDNFPLLPLLSIRVHSIW